VFCVADSTKIDQYCAPTCPSRKAGTSAHNVGCRTPRSNFETSPPFSSMNIEGRSLWVSINGALSNKARARSSTAALGDASAANVRAAALSATALEAAWETNSRRVVMAVRLRVGTAWSVGAFGLRRGDGRAGRLPAPLATDQVG